MFAVCIKRFIPIGQINPVTGLADNYRADFSKYEEWLVKDVAEAKKIYGGAPILEKVRG